MSIVLYSTHCPKCLVLESKLKEKNIEFDLITDQNVMIEKGFMSAPMLEVNGDVMDFGKANNWINEQ